MPLHHDPAGSRGHHPFIKPLRSSPRHLVIDEAKPDADAHGCELNFIVVAWTGQALDAGINERMVRFNGVTWFKVESKCGDVLTLRRKTDARGPGVDYVTAQMRGNVTVFQALVEWKKETPGGG